MKKIISILVLILCLSVNTYPFLHDFVAKMQRKAHHLQNTRFFKKYIKGVHENYVKWRQSLDDWARHLQGFLDEELEPLQLDIDGINEILDSPLYRDRKHLDPWRDIFRELQRIQNKFLYVDRTDYLKKNQFYRKNAKQRKKIDESISEEKRAIKALEAKIRKLSTIKKLEEKKQSKLETYDKLIADYSLQLKEKKPGGKKIIAERGKVEAVNAFMFRDLLEIAITDLTIKLMALEDKYIEKIEEIDYTNKEGVYDAE